MDGTVETGTPVYSDESKAYEKLPNFEAVKQRGGEYGRGRAHTDEVELHRSMLKRGFQGTYHKMMANHLTLCPRVCRLP